MGTAKQKDRPKAVFSVALIASESGYVERAIPPPIYTQFPHVLIYAAPAGSVESKNLFHGRNSTSVADATHERARMRRPAFNQGVPLNRHFNGKLRSKQQDQIHRGCFGGVSDGGVGKLAYQIVAVKENETVRCERISVLIAIAKARVWTSEGWQVVIMDETGKALEPVEFDKLLAA
jgi:hypothetical protein